MRSLDPLSNDLVVDNQMPAVRLRAGDVLVLAEHFLRKLAVDHGKVIEGFTDSAREKVLEHAWLRDVRELESAIEEAIVRCNGARIDADDLSFEAAAPESSVSVTLRIPGTTIAELERHAIIKTLEACGGSTAKAAEILGISIRTIQYRMHAYGLRGTASNEPQVNAS
jgi:two-component system, NtrC family, response regulator HydG